MNDLTSFFEAALEQVLGKAVKIDKSRRLSGGDINLAARLDTSMGAFFIKWQHQDHGDMFAKEDKGLSLLASASCISTPKVVGHGKLEYGDFLILEYLNKGYPTKLFWENFGKSLAYLHQHSQEKFGLDHDNFIGRLPQPNGYQDNWIAFFVSNRLDYQIKYGIDHGTIPASVTKTIEPFYQKLSQHLPDERSALLHGDLWSGNFMVGTDGEVVIYDPAVYFGHREMELAFTHLFGGFDQQFYQSYEEIWPLQPGFEDRIEIYQLYPLLVHANLFGGGYLSSALRIISRFS